MVSLSPPDQDNVPMVHLKLERVSVDYALLLAKRRAASRTPFSQAWHVAIAAVEDFEREAFRLDQMALGSGDDSRSSRAPRTRSPR